MTLPRITKIFDERVLDNILHPPYDIHVIQIKFTLIIMFKKWLKMCLGSENYVHWYGLGGDGD